MVCMKEAGANAGFSVFSTTRGDGDVVFDHLAWTQAAHAQFSGMNAVAITNSTVMREPPAPPRRRHVPGALPVHGHRRHAGPWPDLRQRRHLVRGAGHRRRLPRVPGRRRGHRGVCEVGGDVHLHIRRFRPGHPRDGSGRRPGALFVEPVLIAPYAGPGYAGPPYAQSPTSCSGVPGQNCITDVFVPCPSRGSTMHGPVAYCPVKPQPG